MSLGIENYRLLAARDGSVSVHDMTINSLYKYLSSACFVTGSLLLSLLVHKRMVDCLVES